MSNKDKVIILMADDDDNDRNIIKDAFNRSKLDIKRLILAENGIDLMKKLSSEELKGCPILIMLDLNMPHKNGYQVLHEIKQNPDTQNIPIVIWTTSNRQEDINQCYSMGANSYIVKPDRLANVIKAIKTMWMYWIDLVEITTKETED